MAYVVFLGAIAVAIVLGVWLIIGISSLFLTSCTACKMRMARTATKCPWCHEYVAKKVTI